MRIPQDTLALMVELRTKGLTIAKVADELNRRGLRNTIGGTWNENSVTKWLSRTSTNLQQRRCLGPEEDARIQVLAAEGVPYTWIAEDLNCDAGSVAYRAPKEHRAEQIREWRSTWAYIRHNPTLLAMHQEFRPKVNL